MHVQGSQVLRWVAQVPAKIRLKELQLGQLDHDCLLLVNKFLRAVKAHDGTVLRIRDKDILMQISRCAKKSKNPELISIYHDLKDAIVNSVQDNLKAQRNER